MSAEGDGVGIDVETARSSRIAQESVALVAGDAERAELTSDEQIIERWVAKEAALKAAGVGLRVDPAAVRLAQRGGRLQIVEWPLPIEASEVHLHPLHPGDGYCGVAAIIDAHPVTIREITV